MIGFILPGGEFEYDARGLLMSFFPGEEFVMNPDEEFVRGAEELKEGAGEPTAAPGVGAVSPGAGAASPGAGAASPGVGAASPGAANRLIRLPEPPRAEGFDGSRNDRKNIFKRDLYRYLCELTGKTLPWGTLTGIRPVRIVSDLLAAGRTPEEAAAIFARDYFVSPEKTALSLDIALREREALMALHDNVPQNNVPQNGASFSGGYSLYIGIPFCPTRCLYCSFTSYPAAAWKGRMGDYLDCLFEEIDWASRRMTYPPDTVYIGGGTPTALSADLLDRLLDRVCGAFDLGGIAEFTVEAGRPDSIDAGKLQVMKRYPVSRISVNPQTMSQATLDRIGRRHTVEDTERAFWLAREHGFDNINMDIIIGLPGEGPADVEHTCAKLTQMRPESLTVHTLAVKRASRLKMEAAERKRREMEALRRSAGRGRGEAEDAEERELRTPGEAEAAGIIELAPQGEMEQMMRIASDTAAALDLHPYYLYRQKNMAGNLENVGYAADGRLCIYNIVNMEEVQTVVALGAGTVTKAVWPDGLIERCDNVKDIALYMDSVREMIARKEKLLSGF